MKKIILTVLLGAAVFASGFAQVSKDIADKANLTKDQYQALASAYIDINNENYLNYNKQLEEKAAEELKTSEAALKARAQREACSEVAGHF